MGQSGTVWDMSLDWDSLGHQKFSWTMSHTNTGHRYIYWYFFLHFCFTPFIFILCFFCFHFILFHLLLSLLSGSLMIFGMFHFSFYFSFYIPSFFISTFRRHFAIYSHHHSATVFTIIYLYFLYLLHNFFIL